MSPLQYAGRQPSQTTTSSLSSRWLPLPTRDTHSDPADIVNFLSQEFPIDPYLPYHLARTRSVRRVPRSARVSSPLHWPIYPIVGQPHCFRVLLCALSTPKRGWLVPERSIESQVVQIPSWPHREIEIDQIFSFLERSLITRLLDLILWVASWAEVMW